MKTSKPKAKVDHLYELIQEIQAVNETKCKRVTMTYNKSGKMKRLVIVGRD
jgi:hypothetical protein